MTFYTPQNANLVLRKVIRLICTFVVKEVVSYYINNDSAAYSCAIDMSKAFDRVDLVKLFKKLSLRALPVHIIRILFALYYNLCIKVS